MRIGLLGGGQLGRMMIQAAHRLGHEVVVLDPDAHGPAAQIADQVIVAQYDDLAALDRLAAAAEVFTTEFENVPADSLRRLSASGPTFPSASAIEACQDRLLEKQFMAQAGVPVVRHANILSAADLAAAPSELFPGILKTRRMGYDGKGQARVASLQEAQRAFVQMGSVPCLLEQRVALDKELSVILARDRHAKTVTFPVAENRHEQGILDTSHLPANIDEAIQAQARLAAESIAVALNYQGVLCVEFFLTQDGQLLANEMAPRPHNSGHATIEACATSQFEQQVRVCTNMPLGSTALRSAAEMKNLLGDLWFPRGSDEAPQEPDWSRIAPEGSHLHLYGKSEPRPGRKMGHLTILKP